MVEVFTAEVWTWFIVIAAATVGVFWLVMESKLKHRVIIKDATQNTVIIKIFRARSFVDKDMSRWWKLAGEKDKEKKLLPMPPDEVIQIDQKGRKYAQCIRFETGEVVWCKDNWQLALNVPQFELTDEIKSQIDNEKDPSKKKELLDNYLKDKEKRWRKENNIVSPFQPVTSNQRMAYFYNIKKAEARKGFAWKEHIVQLAALTSLTVIVIALLLFYGEVATPVLKANEQVINVERIHTEQLLILKEIKTGQQTIDERITKLENEKNSPD